MMRKRCNMVIEIFNIFETRRGKLCFNIDNFILSEFRILIMDIIINFRCIYERCFTSFIVNNLNKIIKKSNTHNHEEYKN